jgi:histidyl-tRNA synthetase
MQKCKGCRDLIPQDMLRFRHIENAFVSTCSGWGYNEIRTPTLEYLYLFTSAGTLTPNMLKRVYSFLDWDGWSGERVVLKPDATIPAARYYIEQLADKGLARLCYVTNTFIFEETGSKNRERWQCGAEIIGARMPLADTELVLLSLDILHKLGLENIEIKLSHAGLIRSLLSSLGLNLQEQSTIFNQILDGNTEPLESLRNDKPEAVEALNLLLSNKGCSPGFLKNIHALLVNDASEFQSSLDNFTAVLNLMEAQGVNYQIDLTVGKGFEYYTGIIFRLYAAGENVGGGGRYDQLIETMGGMDTPAAGFALYMDKLTEQVHQIESELPLTKRVLVSVTSETLNNGLKLTDTLRQSGVIAELAFDESQIACYGWLLQLHPEKPFIVLSDCREGQSCICQTAADVLKKMGVSAYES